MKDVAFEPAWIVEVELSQLTSSLSDVEKGLDRGYTRARCLVRLHGEPLGVIELGLREDKATSTEYSRQILQALDAQVAAHLARDGVTQVESWEQALADLGSQCARQPRPAPSFDGSTVSIVIATRDRAESLARCLQSIMGIDYSSYEIVVVDNAPSSNATADFIRQTYGDDSKVRYVREDVPGLAIAHNRGLQEVTTPIVAFTDDDVVVDKHWLTAILNGFNSARNVACVTGMIYPAAIETQAQEWIEEAWGFCKGFERRVFDRQENRLNTQLYPYTAGVFGSGANMAFTTAFLKEIGGFDPALGAGTKALGGDDLATFFQVIQKGHKLVYEPSAIVHHSHRREYAQLRRQAYGYGVGLTAYLTSIMMANPRTLLDFAIKSPLGLYYLFNPNSSKNSPKSDEFPSELTKLERKGMIVGPFAYFRSRWRTRKMRNSLVTSGNSGKSGLGAPSKNGELRNGVE